MTFLKVILVLVQVISGLLLIVVILLQKSKDGGLGVAFGSNMGENLFGARTGNILTKITIVLAIVFILNTFLLALVSTHSRPEQGSLIDRAGTVTPSAPSRMPASPSPMPQGSAMPADNRGAAMPAPGGTALPDTGNSAPAMPASAAPISVDVPATALPAPEPVK